MHETRRQRTTPVLSDFFQIKRGLVTGDNQYFVLTASEIAERDLPIELFRPILPSPRYLPDSGAFLADGNGLPVLKQQLFLLDTRLDEEQILGCYPGLSLYLQLGKSRRVHERYICRHRLPWYSQETRPPAPIVCASVFRPSDGRNGRPFRFILNHSAATGSFRMSTLPCIPRQDWHEHYDSMLLRRIWQALNHIAPEQLLGEGRVYGGGLHKLEPKELANVDATAIAALVPDSEFAPAYTQLTFLIEQ